MFGSSSTTSTCGIRSLDVIFFRTILPVAACTILLVSLLYPGPRTVPPWASPLASPALPWPKHATASRGAHPAGGGAGPPRARSADPSPAETAGSARPALPPAGPIPRGQGAPACCQLPDVEDGGTEAGCGGRTTMSLASFVPWTTGPPTQTGVPEVRPL